MELLQGEDLANVVAREGPQPVRRVARWLIEACDAIAEAHRLGIVHRDVKPSNLFLARDGVKVLDFGIAKRVAAKEPSITQSVGPLGTPQYMSPEQVRCAKDVDPRTDVWSIGVTLYELLTGRTPFFHEVPQACIVSIVADPVPDPRTFRSDLPPDLAAVIMKALRKDPRERWATVPDLAQALRKFAEPKEGELLGASVRPSRRRSKRALLGAAVLGMAALAFLPTRCVGRIHASPTRLGSPETKTEAAPIAPSPVTEPVATAENAPSKDVHLGITAKSKRPFPAKPVRTQAPPSHHGYGDSVVHGGLSGPGF
jgi:serine/threonine-protein kinase